MSEEVKNDDLNPEDDNEAIIERSWQEFTRRLNEDRIISFDPRCCDVAVSAKNRGFFRSLDVWFRAVFLPMPIELFLEFSRVVKMILASVTIVSLTIFAILAMLPLFVLRRAWLTVWCLPLGLLKIEPTAASIANHLNKRMWKVRREMEAEGYDCSPFFSEVHADDIDDERRAFILRNWKD